MLDRRRCETAHVSEGELLVVSRDPLNAETILEHQAGPITPIGRHYVRTHFPIPDAPGDVILDGAVPEPTAITLDDLRGLPRRTVAVTLECAGNGRKFVVPSVPGEQWGLGAVGTAEWTGASLRDVLERTGPLANATEVLFRGADEGIPKDLGKRIAYERSLPLADALRADVLVAYAMNRAPIPPEHGGPLRLIVPGWYGMASVKWLARITLIDRAFAGFFQEDRYVIDGAPLRTIAPRAVITAPADGAEIHADRSAAPITVRGYAWSGAAPIVRVEVAADPAKEVEARRLKDWRQATLGPASDHAWREFSLELPSMVAATGTMEMDLTPRAVDAAGNVQPQTAVRNALGYANNASRSVRVRVVSG
jgi:DMSO/TMAO reductase YedYZ molybdopterin-dependent catalytic subunit